ncbi:uncharacterized protein LOC125655559 [Ostrea edulis]|uniref:uncharacterized protein LOC125655559 n=1 Tax=Ostrea edulis TaxID=37623 RepID=UPI002094C7D7|nr:uncharacterized protein LOC125655559 [Ostrea edulis]
MHRYERRYQEISSEEGGLSPQRWRAEQAPPSWQDENPEVIPARMGSGVGNQGRCPDRTSRGSRDSKCPLGCGVSTRKMRNHVVLTHLPPVFRRGVPSTPEVSAIRERALRWLAQILLGPDVTITELASTVRAEEVFVDPHCILTPDTVEAMDALCRYVGETPPPVYQLHGALHPALLLHWRAQAILLSWLTDDSRAAYKRLAASERLAGKRLRDYSMRAYTLGNRANSGNPPRQRHGVEAGGNPGSLRERAGRYSGQLCLGPVVVSIILDFPQNNITGACSGESG